MRTAKEFCEKFGVKDCRGVEKIFERWNNFHSSERLEKLAYILATVKVETGVFLPIKEKRALSGSIKRMQDRYWSSGYYGRGFVQITWKFNYVKLDNRLGLNGKLVENPDLALDFDIATRILFVGMFEGLFTGRKLDDYFPENDSKADWLNARKIIIGNGFKAKLTAYWAKIYFKFLTNQSKEEQNNG